MSKKLELDLRLYVITDRLLSCGRSHREVVACAIAGGATCIQLREKDLSTRELYVIAEDLRRLTREKGVTFIINDRLDVALAVGADGVHLGPDDLPLAAARRLMPPEMILGASAGNLKEALEAQRMGATYLGVGSVFATATKADAGEPIGPEGLSYICHRVSIPVVGIGGINASNARSVMEAGAAGVAVISSVVAASDIASAAKELFEILEQFGATSKS